MNALRKGQVQFGENTTQKVTGNAVESIKNILFLVPYPFAKAPSQRFRFEHFLPFFENKELKYELHAFLDEDTWLILYQSGHIVKKVFGIIRGIMQRALLLFRVHQFDYIFIHREASPIGPPVIEFILAKIFRKKIIYDFDDAIWLSDKSLANRFSNVLKWRRKVKKICKWSWKICVGNEYLADFAREHNDHVFVIPTVVDTENMHHPNKIKNEVSQKDAVIVGWTGSHSTLKYLELILPVIETLEKKSSKKILFRVIANHNPELPLQSYQFVPWSKFTEIEDLSQIDIGIMPLPDNKWTKGKCGFKAIQYMALGIPAVVSPLAVNKSIVDNGINGFHCSSYEEWLEKLLLLIEDKSLRVKMGNAGREKIVNYYSVNSIKSEFFKLFDASIYK